MQTLNVKWETLNKYFSDICAYTIQIKDLNKIRIGVWYLHRITNYFLGSTAAADEIHLEQNQAPSKKINFSDMAQRFADG